VKGQSSSALLDTYTKERRGAILDTLAELTKTTLFITTPSPGIALVREAVLSLSLSENFLNNLFDPYASAPYDYVDSALNAELDPLDDFGHIARPGSLLPDVEIGSTGERLYEQFDAGFTVITFAANSKITQSTFCSNPAASVLTLPVEGKVASLLDAKVGTTFLLRPDNRVAGRWRNWSDSLVHDAIEKASVKPLKELV
jgi:3-(3-hydroxy-phenyl)propionate hydroxylase